MKGWSSLSSSSRSATKLTRRSKITFGALNLVSFDDDLFLDALHRVDLVVGDVVDHVNFAVAASANHFQDLEITFGNLCLLVNAKVNCNKLSLLC